MVLPPAMRLCAADVRGLWPPRERERERERERARAKEAGAGAGFGNGGRRRGTGRAATDRAPTSSGFLTLASASASASASTPSSLGGFGGFEPPEVAACLDDATPPAISDPGAIVDLSAGGEAARVQRG